MVVMTVVVVMVIIGALTICLKIVTGRFFTIYDRCHKLISLDL